MNECPQCGFPLTAAPPRRPARHRAYFASVYQAWQNLSGDWPSDEHLRKWALIKTGWRDERSLICGSDIEARKVGAFIRPMDTYALVVIDRYIVTVYTARSQSYRAMDKDTFNRSADDVLAYLSQLLDVPQPVLEAEGRDA